MDTTEMIRIGETVGTLVQSLMEDNRAEIKEIWAASEDAKMSLSASITLSGAITHPAVFVKLSFAKKITDEASEQLEDPNAPTLPGVFKATGD